MKRLRWALAWALAGVMFAPLARAEADITQPIEHKFCDKPAWPLSSDVRELCGLAAEVPNCAGLLEACERARAEEEAERQKQLQRRAPAWMERLAKWLAELSLNDDLLTALRAVGITALILLALWAIRRVVILAPWRNTDDDQSASTDVARDVVMPTTPADELWRDAELAYVEGRAEVATRLYLHAAIEHAAERGKIVKSPSSTYGECTRQIPRDERGPLVELRLEVENHDFGGRPIDAEAATRARNNATSFVRALGVLLAVFMMGCDKANELKKFVGGDGGAAAMDSLWPLLHASNFSVSRVPTALYDASFPQTTSADAALWLDLSVTELDDDARRHLGEWVKRGGLLLVARSKNEHFMGATPSDTAQLSTLRLHVDVLSDPNRAVANDEALSARSANCDAAPFMLAHKSDDAYDAIFAPETTLMSCDEHNDAPEAYGAGVIRRFPGASAFSNLGLMRPQNAEFAKRYFELALTLDDGHRQLFVAGPDSGTKPASSPVHALYAAGLGPFFWQGVFATFVLLLAGSKRLGTPRRVISENKERYADHVETLGLHYAVKLPMGAKRQLVARWLQTRNKTRNAP